MVLATAQAVPTKLGDLDEDGMFTVLDLTRLVGHSSGAAPLSETLIPFADLNQDGFINDADQTELVNLILGTGTPQDLPLDTVREVSPATGESNVAVTRETVLHFAIPLALNATLDTTQFYAEFGGRKILSRVEIASDRKKATLFYLEPLPSNARVKVTFDSTGVNDLLDRAMDGDGDKQAGGTYTTTFDTVSITAVVSTAITGRVFASELGAGGTELPLAGVTITVDGSEETLRCETDAQGNFILNPCPAGEFFVHIDGRTSSLSSYPDGSYYPVVGKKWHAVAGRTDNLAVEGGTIYLPLIANGTLQAVSATQNSVITFPASVIAANPALAGVQIDVPANSLFADDGTRGGRIGIAPVASDRLPEPLPPGLKHTIDISIQSDGAMNFDRPVPVIFPNLPDPVTGEKLPPGAKSALWSFNHDTGEWEVVGPMTVTEDGNFVKTDVGVGVRQPGWHGTQPGTQGSGGQPIEDRPHDKPPCDVGFWDALDLAEKFLADSYDCAKDLAPTKIPKALFAFAKAVKIGEEIREKIEKVPELIKAFYAEPDRSKGVRYLEQATAIIDLIHTTLCKELSDQLDVVREEAGFAKKLRTVLDCVDAVLSLLTNICNIDDGNCNRSTLFHRNVCPLIPHVKAFWDYLKSFEEAADELEHKLVQTISCLAVDHLKISLEEALNIAKATGAKVAAQSVTGTQATASQLDVLLASVVADADSIDYEQKQFALLKPKLEVARTSYDQMDSGILDSLAGLSKDMRSAGGTKLRKVYFRIWGDGFEFRGRANRDGSIGQVMPPTEFFHLDVFDSLSGEVGHTVGRSSANGGAFNFNPIRYFLGSTLDTDGDDLANEIENILGTDPDFSDSDADGIPDGTEVKQGTNPLDGLTVQTGTIASAPTSAAASDICALNNIAVVAQGDRGVCVFNVFSGLNPTRILEVDTPGLAQAVACGGRYVAVADGGAGLAILDVGDPGNIRLTMQVPVGGTATSVATDGITAYVGTAQGQVVEVDLETGRELRRLVLASASTVEDLQLVGDALYVLQSATLRVVTLTSSNLVVAGSLSVSLNRNGMGHRFRLFVAAGKAYCVHAQGYRVVDVSNAASPTLLQSVADGQQGWKQLVLNGSGLGLACAGPNPNSSGVHDLNLHNVGADGLGSAFITTMATPGIATAVSVYNGFAYVADGASGLQVINFLAFDNQKQVPTIALSANVNLASGTAEEGKRLRLTAAVTDDVQVRNVEFYVDGQLAVTDGSYPFEYAFIAPSRSATKTTVQVKAKATDTGGNFAWTPEYTLTLVPDATPPTVVAFSPKSGDLVGAIKEAFVRFSEPMKEASLTGTVQVLSPGADSSLGTTDDVVVPATLSFRTSTNTAFLTFASALTPSLYRLSVTPPAADLAGNAVAAATSVDFRVYGFTDSDNDGLADDWESVLGTVVGNQDSNNNGIKDGDEDFDHDGLKNGAEVVLGLDPRNPDSNGNGIADGIEDSDGDGLNNIKEFLAGTDPNKPDTDGDGWNDEVEVTASSDPTNPNSVPNFLIVSRPSVTTMRFGSTADLTSAGSIIKASPDVTVMRFGTGSDLSAAGSLIQAQPSVFTVRFGNGSDLSNSGSVILATPTVNVVNGADSIIAKPPVSVQISP